MGAITGRVFATAAMPTLCLAEEEALLMGAIYTRVIITPALTAFGLTEE